MSKQQHLIDYLRYAWQAQTAHGVHSPFVYKLIETLIDDKDCKFLAFDELNAIRQRLLKDNRLLEITDLGAGSLILKSPQRRVKAIAKHGITRKNFSEFYFKLINYFNCQHVVELGTSLGLNALYLAKAGNKPHVYSIEGCEALHLYAKNLQTQYKVNNLQLVHATFDHALPNLLHQLPQLDFFLVDGNHTYEATLRYFEMALPYHTETSIFVFDDIYWSEGMKKAWQEIKAHPHVSISLNFYYCGLLFFKKGFNEPLHFSIKQP